MYFIVISLVPSPHVLILISLQAWNEMHVSWKLVRPYPWISSYYHLVAYYLMSKPLGF